MKKIFTLLLGTVFTLGAFAQAPKTVLYLTSEVPFAVGDNKNDQFMFDIITDLGYVVTAEKISATSSTSGYDVAFTSEAIGSGDPGWVTYKTAPLPMVMGKVWACKAPALGWVGDENGVEDGGGSYGNCTDSIFVKLEDHELTTGLPDEFNIVENSGEGANGAYVNFSVENPSGVTAVYTTKKSADEADFAGSITVADVEAGSTLNGNTLASQVVILGIHQVVYDALTDDAITLISNCLKYAMGEPIVSSVEDNTAVIETTVYPNPSVGMVNVKFNQYVAAAQVTIMALDGRTIRTSDIFNANSASLDLSDLNSGIYIINIAGTDINYTQSISLQK